jgi:FkbM family methyltransferase
MVEWPVSGGRGSLADTKRFVVSISIALALGALVVGSGALGVNIGIRYKTTRLLFELPKREAMTTAIKQVLGIQRTYAELQQDLWVVSSVFPGKRDGYYVDVGSGDGVFASNTKLLDDLGWKGVCIDPFPTNMSSRTCQLFRQTVFGVSGKKVTFRAAGMLGGVSETLGGSVSSDEVRKSQAVEFSTVTLDEILENAKAPRHIDFMSIDVEGAEYEVLKGLSLDKYEVEAFAIEHNNEPAKRQSIRQLLEKKGYTVVRSWYRDDWYVLHGPQYRFKLVLDGYQ